MFTWRELSEIKECKKFSSVQGLEGYDEVVVEVGGPWRRATKSSFGLKVLIELKVFAL